jgi:hypothetical protein
MYNVEGPVYGVYVSQLIQYSTSCGSYDNFLDRYVLVVKFYGRHHDLVNRYEIAVSQMTTYMFR